MQREKEEKHYFPYLELFDSYEMSVSNPLSSMLR